MIRNIPIAASVFAAFAAATISGAALASAEAPSGSALAVPVLPSPTPTSSAIAAHRAGQIYDYSLHGEVGQSIVGSDALGRAVDQRAMPTTLNGRERVAIKEASSDGLTLHRSGAITATVAGRPVSKPGTGWTLVNAEGVVVRDHGTLGGLFLLPLGFLGERAVKGGAVLAIGDSWGGKLGTKLYGMTARPELSFSVTGMRYVLGQSVYSIDATGTVPMREPVVTNTGVLLGYASGSAKLDLRFDYDRANARVVALDLTVRDTLTMSGTGKSARGKVEDTQRYLVALDAGSISASAVSRSL
ncbi:MAG TPA: hypothetical protein VKT51_02570 [Candidatus Eremiobacteraceae bacterium]|nr:hypothetical protein [Candidatus Eremiobacteraceae bacterium]